MSNIHRTHRHLAGAGLAGIGLALALGTGVGAKTTPPLTPPDSEALVNLELTEAWLNPTPELCAAYQTLQGLLLAAGPEGHEVVDAWIIVTLEESGPPNGRLTDVQRDQVRLAMMSCPP